MYLLTVNTGSQKFINNQINLAMLYGHVNTPKSVFTLKDLCMIHFLHASYFKTLICSEILSQQHDKVSYHRIMTNKSKTNTSPTKPQNKQKKKKFRYIKECTHVSTEALKLQSHRLECQFYSTLKLKRKPHWLHKICAWICWHELNIKTKH